MMATRRIAAALAGMALVAGLLGAGISASYSDSATAAQDVRVGTFGIEVSSSQGTVSPDRHSVTFDVANINASTPGSYSVPFSVTNVGSVPAVITLSRTLPPAPFTDLLGPVAEFTLASGESRDFIGGLGWPELGNEHLGLAATITYTFAASDVPTVIPDVPVAVSPPTVVTGGINIPTVAHVTYSMPAGFNALAPGLYVVTAVADTGYVMTDYPTGGWSLDVQPIGVAVLAPTVTPQACGQTNGGITIPTVANVVYSMPAGFNQQAPGSYVVTATAATGYVLTGYPADGWNLSVAALPCIEFVGVASEGSAYGFSNTIGLPAGWQPGDTAIVFAANATPATPPVIPAGWVQLANASPAYGTSPAAVSRVGSRVLQAGDTSTGIWTNTRDIAVVVYRNVGSVGPAASGGYSTTSTSGTKFVTFPAPAAAKTSTSWLVGLGYLNNSGTYNQVYGITAPAGTVNRTVILPAPPFSGIGTSPRLAVIDSNAGAGWTTSQQVSGGIARPAPQAWAMNGITLELKVAQ